MQKKQDIIYVLASTVRQVVPNAPKLEELRLNKKLLFQIALNTPAVIEAALGMTNYRKQWELRRSINIMKQRLDCQNMTDDERAELKETILFWAAQGKVMDPAKKKQAFEAINRRREENKASPLLIA